MTFLVGLGFSIAGCGAPSIRSQSNAYAYLGRVAEKAEDVDLAGRTYAPGDRPIEQLSAPVTQALLDAQYKNKRYQRYTVALEQGEKVSLRSAVEDIKVGDCVRVWIRGPGVSPVYLYAADQAELDRTTGCK